MPDELESKIRVTEHHSVRDKLRAAGAAYIGLVVETNRLFDNEKWTLLKGGCGLRVRECRALEGPPRPPTLAYKGPQRDSTLKHRAEIEVQVSDAAAITELLHQLGFFERIVFEKKRESWRLGPCEVELDELPSLGLFVEVEGPDVAAIRDIVGRLGLDIRRSIRRSYVAMLAEGTQTHSSHPLEFRFA